MRDFVASIENEYRRYKALAESAMAQLNDEQLNAVDSGPGNSITVIAWHVSGNLESRFSEFIVSDGEKPWRDRDAEFTARTATRAELIARWERGWTMALAALAPLSDADLSRALTIRGTTMRVHEALHRSLSHTAYHVGQNNQAPTHESAQAHAEKLDSERRR